MPGAEAAVSQIAFVAVDHWRGDPSSCFLLLSPPGASAPLWQSACLCATLFISHTHSSRLCVWRFRAQGEESLHGPGFFLSLGTIYAPPAFVSEFVRVQVPLRELFYRRVCAPHAAGSTRSSLFSFEQRTTTLLSSPGTACIQNQEAPENWIPKKNLHKTPGKMSSQWDFVDSAGEVAERTKWTPLIALLSHLVAAINLIGPCWIQLRLLEAFYTNYYFF